MRTREQVERAAPMAENAPNRIFERALHRIPEPLRATFTPDQLTALERALRPQNREHVVDYRVSLPWFGRRVYITLLAGPENRSLDRLRAEGQVAAGRIAATYGTAMAGIIGLMIVSGSVLVYSISKIFDAEGTSRMTYLQIRR